MNITAKSWAEEQQDWLKQHREKQVQETGQQQGKLVTDRANQCLRETTDKTIKNPGVFIRELNNILKEVQNIKQGAAERLKHEIIDFLNDFQVKARQGNAKLPATFQRTCLLDATEFDKTGTIIQKLCSIFDEKYGETFEREKILQNLRNEGVRRKFEAAAQLRRIASMLEKINS
jgi:hypothetical protein